MSDTDPPDSGAQPASIRAIVRDVAHSQTRGADATEGLLEGLLEMQGSLAGIMKGIQQLLADQGAVEAERAHSYRKLSTAVDFNTRAVVQLQTSVREALQLRAPIKELEKAVAKHSEQIESIETHLLLGGNGHG